jgi:hypothetical protein
VIARQEFTKMRVLSQALLTAFFVASATHGAAASDAGLGTSDPFSVTGIPVDATAQSPAAARDLAMKQGRTLAWKTLVRRLNGEFVSGPELQLSERELLALILRSEAGNERRNTTRYVADLTVHFNPSAVRQLLRRSNIVPPDAAMDGPLLAPLEPGTHLAVTVRFETPEDWTKLRARLDQTEAVHGVDVVRRSTQEAQIYINHSGEELELQTALARNALELSSREGEYTLELGAASTTTASLQ